MIKGCTLTLSAPSRKPLLVTALFLGALGIGCPAFAQGSASKITGLQPHLTFTEYFPLSQNVEVARRTLSPLVNVEIARISANSPLRLQAIDLAQEAFAIYVPVNRPSQGYGLLAFIPPWQDAHLPAGWATALDESGIIFVSAAKSGNEESVIDRRIPLALLGAHNIMHRYPIDSDRVYIAGFSGGARVAMKVALAYPDLFRGALLNAGSDPIGSREAAVPPEDLFARFQNASRIVYVTGSEDAWNMQHDMVSRDSMHEWCVFGTSIETIFRAGHEIADSNSVRRALVMLDQRAPADAEKLAACRARIAKELSTELRRITGLIDRGNPHDAWHSLIKVDLRYGGLAAPEITRLGERIGSGR